MATAHYRSRSLTSAVARATSTAVSADPDRACAEENLDRFYPVSESESAMRPSPAELDALTVCAACPLLVRAQCLREQLAHPRDQHGVSGGMTKAQRRLLLREGKLSVQVAAQVAYQLGIRRRSRTESGNLSAAA
ncbi:WhiB family transcriptional regulator [Kitasatospora sp. NPDC059646]|uniref:WhiB family transcriptional regulator n=1 Tax=Kitasatospora sp. NPDC059646 TaxID=3346893 RepID=UPI00367AEEC8